MRVAIYSITDEIAGVGDTSSAYGESEMSSSATN